VAAVVVAIGAAGGGADWGAVSQAVAAPVDANNGSTGGWSVMQLGTAPAVRETGGDAGRGSGQ
jgi:hypothetical protein